MSLSSACAAVPALLVALLAAAAPAAAVNLHLLVETPDGVALETVAMPATGELVVSRPDLVTVVLPFGIGRSGDLVPKGRRPARLVARVQDGQLLLDIAGADGRGRALPPVALADLERLDLRVHATGAGGRKGAFTIRGNGPAVVAGGPVLDMFGGKIPLADGDWSLTTETTERAPMAALQGSADCLWNDGLVFTQVRGPGGRLGRFVIDTAAGVTVVARGFLGADAVIEPIEGLEHSAAGVRVVPGAMGGAGGDVGGLLGAADLDALELGGVKVAGVRANVVDVLPELGGGPVAGILGLDVLSRCGRLRLERGAGDAGKLSFDPAPRRGEAAITCPFTIVAKLIVLPATLDGVSASLVLDTGARGSLLPESLAARAKLPPAAAAAREFRGLDGRPLPARPVQVARLALGGAAAGPAVFFAGEVPVLTALGLGAGSGLLGGDLLDAWPCLEIDFAAGVVRLSR